MYRTLSTSALAVATLVALSGCQEGTLFGDNRANIAGPASVLETGVIEPIQVQELVNTINMAAIVKPSVPPTAQVTFDDAVVNYEQAVTPFLKTDRLSESERAMLMGGACAKAYGWSPKK